MTTSSIKIIIPREIHKVWETITAVEAYHTWRSDVSKTEVISEKQFITYTQSSYATTYTITAMEPYRRLELELENSHIRGHWTGLFTPKGAETEINITAGVSAKQLATRPVGQSVFEQTYLRKEEERFLEDVRKVFDF